MLEVRRTYLLLTLLGAVLATAGGVLVSNSAGGSRAEPRAGLSVQADADYIAAVYRGCGEDENCIKSRIEEMVNSDPLGSVKAVLQMFEGQAVPHVGCHWAMHLVGQILKPRTLAGERFDLGRLWLSCNAAPLHGAYESFDIDGDPATVGKKVFEICYGSGFDASIRGHCFHPVGHSVLLSLPAAEDGTYLEQAELACIEGAWANRNYYKQGNGLTGNVAGEMGACLGGAHMGYRDDIVRRTGRPSLAEGQSWLEVLPQCNYSLLPYSCITLYFDDLLSQKDTEGTSQALQLLSWCLERGVETKDLCAYFFGLSLVGSYQEPLSSRILQVCMDAAPVGDRTRLACMRGVLDELDTEISSREPVEQEFCRVLAETPGAGVSCEETLGFSLRYPQLRSPAKLVVERDAAIARRR